MSSENPMYYNLYLQMVDGNPTVYATFSLNHEGVPIGQLCIPDEDHKHLLPYNIRDMVQRLYEVNPQYISECINTTLREPLKHLQIINLEEEENNA